MHLERGAGGARILLVDDDASVAAWFSRAMRLEGHEAWAARSAEEGLGMARVHRPHAVILDLRMPLTNSLRILCEIRKIPGLLTAPCTIVTSDYTQDETQSAEIGALGAKLQYRPVWLKELAAHGRRLLALSVPSS